jgi:hypothetical protein
MHLLDQLPMSVILLLLASVLVVVFVLLTALILRVTQR